MPTNDERREVAERLRKIELVKLPDTGEEMKAIHEAVGCWFGQDHFSEEWTDRLADLIEPEPERTCEWCQDEDGNWHTNCGDIFVLCNCESLENNNIVYCFKCGGVIEVVEYGD